MTEESFAFATRQIHAGEPPLDAARPRATPIYLSAGFVFDDLDQGEARFAGTDDGYSYTRVGNPTITAVEERIADLEGGRGAVFVASGQAATTAAILAVAAAGDHVVAAERIYAGSRELLRDSLGRLGVEASFIADLHDLDAWRAAIRPNTRALFAETIANPTNEVLDIRALADVAHDAGVPLIVDNTLATPYLLRPLEHGADLVVHSASKFMGGHGAALGGALVDGGTFAWDASPERYPHLAIARGADGRTLTERFGLGAAREYARAGVAMRFGPTASPLNAFLILQGIETLSLRIDRHSSTAAVLAALLEAHPAVASVDHCGLASHPDHALAERYLPVGRGSVFSFTLRGGRAAADAFATTVRLFTRMSHLGDTRSLVLHPGSTTYLTRTEEERVALGIHPGTLRLSVGLEDPGDLAADLQRGLAAAAEASGSGSGSGSDETGRELVEQSNG